MSKSEGWLLTAGGQILCRRCQGTSRRTGLQCGSPAERHSMKCRFHGSRATGPTTLEGLERCAQAKWQGKGDTRARRMKNSQTSRLIKVCAAVIAEMDKQ